MIEASSSVTPMRETSPTLPGRTNRMYTPMSNAIGIVMPTLKTPQGLSPRALTTTSDRIAMMMSMIVKVANSAAAPPIGPSSSLAI